MKGRAELEEERDFLLASLRDLEEGRHAGDLAEDDYTSLRDDYTARAAAVMRAIAAGPAPRPRGAPRGGRPKRSLAVTVGVIAGVVALTAGAVTAFSGPRRSGAPITGSLPESAQGRMAQALRLEAQGRASDALKVYDDILEADPGHVPALAYRGWLLKRAGLPELALAALDKAVRLDPRYPDAHFFRGMVLYQDVKDQAGAVAEFRLFLANNPPAEMVPVVEDVLRRAMAEAAPAAG